ncbi:MAG TPA: adenylate/guanylate cyclase domain-containing protein, partial [Sulfuricurvum sp.]|nr:adenylate/guanylate cyclase domain-containing protein [Sulfuricurvum sp.]
MWKNKTLATRIVVLVAAAFVIILIAFYFTVKLLSHEALKKTEKEKAQLIIDTASPLLAVRMHLRQDEKVRILLSQMMENQNITSVKLMKHHQVIAQERKHATPLHSSEYFTLRQEIRDPLNKTYLADLVLSYSNGAFIKQSRMYDFTLLIVMEFLALFVILFTLYLRKLLKPLRHLTTKIKDFEPGKTMKLPTNLRSDEIGQINAALSDMNERISEYDSAQRDKAEQLESEISKKAEELERLLFTDNLTNLPNRMKLLEDLEVRIDSVLIIANIDAFRQINDFYGQQAGDHVIKKVAAVLEQFATHFPNMQTYRLSADEFAIFSQLPIEEDTLNAFLKKISEYFDTNAITFEDIEIDVHITMGAT